MTDIKLNELGDLDLRDGFLSLTDELSEQTVQRLNIKLRTYLGEWFLDLDLGIPYFETVLLKSSSKDLVDTVFRSVVLNDIGIKKLVTFESEITNRQYTLNFSAETISGEIVTLTEQILF